ncbi:hypothetical protein ABLE93_00555 [Xanthobacter sp. KR7-65]|uniref:hypothetical protein n=1 Tax=Xanthobacter sp. KR7-65 TaxID=3156612 RepID=UPI0032B39E9E
MTVGSKTLARIAVAVGLVAVLAAAGWFGFSAWSRAKVRAEVDQAFASMREAGAKADFADATFDAVDQAVTVTGISITSADGTASVKIARLLARGAEGPHDRRVTLEALDLDGLEIALSGDAAAGGTITYSVPQVMIDRYNGPMTLIATGEGKGPFGALRVALRQLGATTAAKVTIPEAKGRIAPAGAPAVEVSYTNLAAEGVNAGAVRSLIIDRSTFVTTTPPPEPTAAPPGSPAPAPAKVTARLDGLVAAQIDTAPLLLMTQQDGPTGKVAETYGRIYGKVVTGPYVVTVEGGPTHGAASLLMENVAIKPSAFDPARLLEMKALSIKGPHLTSAESRRALELSRDLIGGLSFGTVALMQAYTKDKEESGRIGTLRLESLANGVLDGMTFEQVEGMTPDGKATLGRFAVRQLDFNQLARLAAEAESPSPLSALVLFRVMSGLELKDLEVPYGEGGAGVRNEPVKIGTFALSWGGNLGVLPSYLDFALTDVSGPIRPEDGEPFTYLIAAGMKRATVSMGLKAAYDINERTLAIAPVTTEVKDAFKVSIESTLDEVPDSAFSEAAGFMSALPTVAAGPVKVTLTDLGLAKLVFAQLAAAAGVSEADYRAEVVTLAEGIAADLEEASPEAATVGAAAVAFLRNPGTLTVTATPKGRVPLMALAASGDPSILLEAFTFEATATAP